MEPVELIPMARHFCFTENFEMSLLRITLLGSESLIDAFHHDWNDWIIHGQSLHFSPHPASMPMLVEKFVAFKGLGVLIAPFNGHFWLSRLMSRAHQVRSLPKDYFLFQWVKGSLYINKRNP